MTSPLIRTSNIAPAATRCLLGFALLLAQPRMLFAEYGVVPVTEGAGATSAPSGAGGVAGTRQTSPAAKDARATDLLDETLRAFSLRSSPGTGGNAGTATPAASPAEIYGLGEAPVTEAVQPAGKVPESLTENMPASFSGNGDAVKVAGNLSSQYNLLGNQPGATSSPDSSMRAVWGLLGAVALAAWYAFHITKQERTAGLRRHRSRRAR